MAPSDSDLLIDPGAIDKRTAETLRAVAARLDHINENKYLFGDRNGVMTAWFECAERIAATGLDAGEPPRPGDSFIDNSTRAKALPERLRELATALEST